MASKEKLFAKSSPHLVKASGEGCYRAGLSSGHPGSGAGVRGEDPAAGAREFIQIDNVVVEEHTGNPLTGVALPRELEQGALYLLYIDQHRKDL